MDPLQTQRKKMSKSPLIGGVCLLTTGDLISVRLVPGARRARGSPPPPTSVEMTMALRKQKQARSKTTLPPQLAAATLHAAGIDVGAEAHDVAVPPP